MIEALDESIKQLLVEKMPLNLNEVDVSFDVPNREWSASISKPTLNIYLHDIRENLSLKQNDWAMERDDKGRIIRSKYGGRYDLSYLITAWTTNVEDEHRLLWYTLATLVRFPVLPREVLLDPLQKQPYPLYTKVAQPDGVLRNVADVWTALDNQLKPVLPYVVTVAVDSTVISISSEVRSKFLRFLPPETFLSDGEVVVSNTNGSTNNYSEHLQIGGRIIDATDKNKVVRAEVVLLEQGLNVKTDAQSRFNFNAVIQRPKYTFLAIAPGYVTVRKVIDLPSQSYDLEMQPETERAGTQNQNN
ncbi:Pvc16 family protein [Candidatus Chlorohelix sp.]|uniref:Pvc16 family protein n=1 Tax=Candidatus Chlorohelix sp. TaxID=3139201 RepID=UPI003021D8E6